MQPRDLEQGITAKHVREMFDYNPEDGHLRWKKRAARRVVIGAIAGSLRGGYRVVMVHGRHCYAHRLIWLWVHGEWPMVMIDHINGIKDDNCLLNLREATRSENLANQFRKDGLKGVWRNRKRWSARINKDGVRHHLGNFLTPELAHAAYCKAAKSMFGEFARDR